MSRAIFFVLQSGKIFSSNSLGVFTLSKKQSFSNHLLLDCFLVYIKFRPVPKSYIALLYSSMNSSFVTSLGFPGLHGSFIAFSANISKSSSFAP